MNVHEKSFFEKIRRKYGITKLSLVSDADEQPEPKTLRDKVDESELRELARYNHTAFGSVEFRNENGKERFARMRVSWT